MTAIEELIASNSKGMNDAQKAEYWWQLEQSIFALLGKVEIANIEPIDPETWTKIALMQYPSLTDLKIPDSMFYTCDLWSIQQMLSKDWGKLVPYVAGISDCDKYANRLYDHLCTFYKINAVLPVWGDVPGGYHGFNLGVFREADGYLARLIEPQTDQIFVNQGPLGLYVPRQSAEFLGVKPLSIAK